MIHLKIIGYALSLLLASTLAMASPSTVQFRTEKIDNLDIFYREAGPKNKPVIVLLHGFPTSSHMFRNLIPKLAEHYHVIAPDYPGFGRSSQPSVTEFEYTFDALAGIIDKLLEKKKVSKYSLYLMDYGAPVGYRMAVKHPERIQALIVQNGNAYNEGLKDFWKPIKAYWADKSEKNTEPLKAFVTLDGVKWQYTHGVKNEANISPDNWIHDMNHLSAKGNGEIQLELFYDYGTNPPLYPSWQAYFREHQPPTLIVWGKNDYIFPADGAYPYKKDLKKLEFHLLDTGHFALEEQHAFIAQKMIRFLSKHVK